MSDEIQDSLAETLRAAYPDTELPQGFEERLKQKLAPRKLYIKRRVALTLATGAVGAALFLGVSALLPRPAFALKKVQEAFGRVKTMHQVEYIGTTRYAEKWYDGTRYRSDSILSDRLVRRQVVVGKNNYIYYPEKKLYTVDDFFEELPSPVSSLSRILRQVEKSGLRNAVEVLGERQLNGRRAEVYKINLPRGAYQLGGGDEEKNYTLFIDPATNLPFQIEERRTENGQWGLLTSKITYDEAIPEDTFALSFPEATRKSARDVYYKNWHTQITEMSRRTRTIAGVTICHFEVLEALGLMVWFTTENNEPATITLIGKGNDCPLLARGTVGESDPKLAARYTLQGRRLQWAVFQQTFVAPMGNGDWELTVGTQGKSETVRPIINSLIGGALPSCEPIEEIRKLHPTLAGERCRDRAEFFLDGRWRKDYPLVAFALTGQMDPHETALRWLQQAVNEDGPILPHAADWRRMADCYEALGRHTEAMEYRSKADRE